MAQLFHFQQVSSSTIAEVENFLSNWHSKEKKINLRSSGSTGKAKVIQADKDLLIESARMTGAFFDFNTNHKILICLPTTFIAGKMMLIRALKFQMTAIITEPNDPLNYNDDLSLDFCAMTPYQYEKALNLNPNKLLKIKTVLLGGAPVSPILENKIAVLNQNVFHSYGMTETYSHVAIRKVNGKNEPFQALEDISFDITKDNCLIINAPKIGVEHLITNDLVTLLNQQQFFFLGRKDFVVNSGGMKLQPELLEKKIDQEMKGVRYFFGGLSSEILGQELVLFIEHHDTTRTYDFSNLLNKYERPKKIIFLKEFKNTNSGKINRIETIKSYFCQ